MNNEICKNSSRKEPAGEADRLAHEVIGAAIEVHRELGPGFLESVYEEALCVELKLRGIPFVRQAVISVVYKGHPVGKGRIDLIVGGTIIVELKTVDSFSPIHMAKTISYLKTKGLQLGLLINFNVVTLKDGIKRVVFS
jgi:GxxExxY protein